MAGSLGLSAGYTAQKGKNEILNHGGHGGHGGRTKARKRKCAGRSEVTVC
jgi:hypothetical protein